MVDPADAYVEVQRRLIGTVVDLDEDGSESAVRSCPGWSVRDTLAHHVGAMADAVSGNMPEFGDDFDLFGDWEDSLRVFAAMSARQIKERSSRSVAAIVDEWREVTPLLLPMIRGEVPFPAPTPAVAGALAINDVVVHEGDIRQALGLAPAPTCAALSLALGNYAFALDMRVRSMGLPALRLAYEGKERVLGGDQPAATLRADRHTMVRVLAARRSAEQILTLDWEGDPTPYVDVLPAYGPVDASDADCP